MTDGRLPNFLVIGAMKAGTTSLFHYLSAHPQVHMAAVKELDFFVEEGNWHRGLDWYRQQFSRAPAESVAIGEASTRYTKFPSVQGVPERIAHHLPDVRLVYVVRDPVERIRSHYEHRVSVGAESEPMERAVRDNPVYLESSRYATQLEQYEQWFPRDRILVITAEALRHQRRHTVARVYEFLGVDAAYVPDGLEVEFYRSDDRPSYPAAVWWLRRTVKRWFPQAKRAKELVDGAWVGARRRVLSVPKRGTPPSSPGVPAGLRTELVAELRDEVARLRPYLSRDFDGWGID